MSAVFTESLAFAHGPYGPLPWTTGVLLLTYCGGLGWWVWHWARRAAVQSVALQRYLTILPLTKALAAVLAWACWWHCAPLGVGGECDRVLIDGLKVADALYSAALYTCLLFLAKGLYYTRRDLEPIELRTTCWNVSLMALSTMLRSLRRSDYFVFPLVVMFLVVLAHIYSSININLHALEQYLANLAQLGINPATTLVFRKALTFRKLQHALGVYLCLQGLFQVTLQLNFISSWLVITVCDNVTDLFILGSLALLYRFREVRPYVELGDDDASLSSRSFVYISPSTRVFLGLGVIERFFLESYIASFDMPNLRPWQDGMPLPLTTEEARAAHIPLVPMYVAKRGAPIPPQRPSLRPVVVVEQPVAGPDGSLRSAAAVGVATPQAAWHPELQRLLEAAQLSGK
eukprot:TRINITY_DN20518_c0_g1_i1.p1 TRINITY_DN20518_c0_g1~~TRINITY_DN20518_c0_g1_i1.p1  ORF type:complete len:403 (+),score=69.06 TRINITY_DN20518_c0_g1_i1:185-1393(+)